MIGIESTLQQRAAAAMEHAHITEADLVRACQRLLGAGHVDQRKINRVITPKSVVKNSAFVPAIAEVTGVRAVWLQWGVGEMLAGHRSGIDKTENARHLLDLIDNLKEELDTLEKTQEFSDSGIE